MYGSWNTVKYTNLFGRIYFYPPARFGLGGYHQTEHYLVKGRY